MSEALTIYVVNSFVGEIDGKALAGNPAGVCLTATPLPETLMQAIAKHVGLSETAFVSRNNTGTFFLRWFTPTTEVALCGHATLAAAHVLWESGDAHPSFPIVFETKSGLLTASASESSIRLDFPEVELLSVPKPLVQLIEEALGLKSIGCQKGGDDSGFIYVVEVKTPESVIAHQPNTKAIASLKNHGVIITAKGKKPVDITSRYYAPCIGIPEDPVTGSAHCALMSYWGKKLKKDKLLAYQASERGGVLTVEKHGDRVILEGEATTVNTVIYDLQAPLSI